METFTAARIRQGTLECAQEGTEAKKDLQAEGDWAISRVRATS